MAVARLSLVLTVALVVLSGCSSPSYTVLSWPGKKTPTDKAASVKADKERKPAPDFELKDVNGHVVRLSDYRGKVVLLDFWATWCGPCKIEIPWFKEFEQQNKDKGFAVIGVAMDEEGWEVVKPYSHASGINYRLVIGDDDVAQQFGGVDALPTTFLIDREGRIASVHVGLASKRDFEDGIEVLLSDSGSPALPAVLVRAN